VGTPLLYTSGVYDIKNNDGGWEQCIYDGTSPEATAVGVKVDVVGGGGGGGGGIAELLLREFQRSEMRFFR